MPNMNSIIDRTEFGRGNPPLVSPKTKASKALSTRLSKSLVEAVTIVAITPLEGKHHAREVNIPTLIDNPQPQLVDRENLDRYAPVFEFLR